MINLYTCLTALPFNVKRNTIRTGGILLCLKFGEGSEATLAMNSKKKKLIKKLKDQHNNH